MSAIPDVDSLTLEERVGQMLCFGWGGEDCLYRMNDQARGAIREARVGGVIVMGRNVQPAGSPRPPVDPARVRAMLDEMQGESAIPLLVTTDQEGGRVARFGPPFTAIPPAAVVGRADDPALAREAARVTAAELWQVGITMNCAPVADVHSNPDNPVIGDRSFGPDPARVGEFVTAQVAGLRAGGLLSCAKHFPGHGDTALDSHLALPTVPLELDALEARELAPFRAVIGSGVDAIMTAHILFPAIDPSGLPATMSRAILTDLLRERMGFGGLVVTDCLEMKAVRDHWGTPRAAVLAAWAGADLLLVCHTEERQSAVRAALLAAVDSGELSRERVTQAAARVLAAKRSLSDLPVPPVAIGAIEHRRTAAAIAERAGLAWEPPHAPSSLGAEAIL